ncbi:MAG: DCC1-like thiol-disulfide oxidoreductase family protein [Chlamydiota bacterium]
MKKQHLVFYDGECGLCDRVVQIVLEADKKKIFLFAPLQGETSAKELRDVPEDVKQADSVILIENYTTENEKLTIYGKAAFRIMWLLGGKWKLLGWLSFLPAFLYDWGYWIVAGNRHRFFRQDICIIPPASENERFLK